MPSPTPTQLIGGQFQDSEGHLLAGGALTFTLNNDESVNDSEICSGVTIRVALDSSGNVASSTSTPSAPDQFLWANDVLLPVNSYYTVTGYSASGQQAWGNNNQQILSGGVGGGTFDLGSWVPNQVVSWVPPLQPLNIEVAGVPFSSTASLLFENTGNVIFTDLGNGQIAANASGGFVPNAASYFTNLGNWGGVPTEYAVVCQESSLGSPTMAVQIQLDTPVVLHKASINITLFFAGTFVSMALYSADGATKIADFSDFDSTSTGIKTTTLGTPVTLPAGNYLVAWNGNGGNSGPQALGIQNANVPVVYSGTSAWYDLLNLSAPRYVYATGVLSGSTMPASLGTLAPPSSVGQVFPIPAFLFE